MPAPIKFQGWPQGVNTILSSESLPVDTLRRAVNFDIDDLGKISVREGRTKVYNGSIQRGSLWSGSRRTLFVEQGNLKELVRRIDGTFSAHLIRTGIGSYPVQYLELNGLIYYTNGLVTGLLDQNLQDLPWGLPAPETQPNAAAGTGGALHAGTYQVAVTFISELGEESGTGLAREVTLESDDASIVLTDFPPAPAGTYAMRIYCSHRNGEGLYRVADVAPGTLSHQITRVANAEAGGLLRTQFGIPPPAGHLLEYHNGRIFIARENIVWFTEPLRYNLVKPRQGFFWFPERVTVLKGVNSGIYACSDLTYFISGIDTGSLLQRDVLPYGGIYNTGIDIPNFDAVAWWSPRGLVFGGENGEVLNVTEDRIAMSDFGEGAMFWREHKGLRQFVVNLWDGTLTSYVAPDYVALELARGGDYL